MWFKDWLQTTGHMRQIHDIAKLEKAASGHSMRSSRSSSRSSRQPGAEGMGEAAPALSEMDELASGVRGMSVEGEPEGP